MFFAFGGFGFPGLGVGAATPAVSPFIGAQAGANDLTIGPGTAVYPAANATVYRVYEYAVPVTTVATVPSAFPQATGLGTIGLTGTPVPAATATPTALTNTAGASPFGISPFGGFGFGGFPGVV